MPDWKRNLFVLCAGQFLVMAGMTMIVPFLPLYLQELGMNPERDDVALWAGLIFAGNFVTSFVFQPIWGALADRYGRKIMLLRSGYGMAAIMALMGFAQDAWHLLVLRVLNGVVSGFVPASVSLMSTSAPRERTGFAMGALQSGGVAGTILGPLIGGWLADRIGFRPIFYVTGACLFMATTVAWIVVRERFERRNPSGASRVSLSGDWRKLVRKPELPALFAATFFIQFALLGAMPVLPLYVQKLHGSTADLAFLSGLAGAVTGISNMIAAPLLGRLGDKIGTERVLFASIVGAAATSVPQAWCATVGQLLVCRFALGLFMGGLIPSVNALVRHHSPEGMVSRAYGFNTSALALGNMVGPVVGGFLSETVGLRSVFWLGGALLAVNAAWVWATLGRRGGKPSTAGKPPDRQSRADLP